MTDKPFLTVIDTDDIQTGDDQPVVVAPTTSLDIAIALAHHVAQTMRILRPSTDTEEGAIRLVEMLFTSTTLPGLIFRPAPTP